MQRNSKAIWVSLAVLGVIILAGVAGISLQAEEPIAYGPNDRANHHPLHPSN